MNSELEKLEFEMRAFAERHSLPKKSDGTKYYSEAGKAALKWADRIKDIRNAHSRAST